MESERFVKNKYDPNKINENKIKEEIKNQINIIKSILNEKYKCDADKKIYSNGKEKIDFSFYTGTGFIYKIKRKFKFI